MPKASACVTRQCFFLCCRRDCVRGRDAEGIGVCSPGAQPRLCRRRRSQSVLEEHQLNDPIIPDASVAEINYEVIQDARIAQSAARAQERAQRYPYALSPLPLPPSFLLPPPWLTVFLPQRIFFSNHRWCSTWLRTQGGLARGLSRSQCESVRRCLLPYHRSRFSF